MKSDGMATCSSPTSMESFWPLTLTAYEQYMLLDDRATHPMTFCIEVLCEGELHQTAMIQALRDAVLRHPLLRATVQKRFGRRAQWISCQNEAPIVFLSPEDYENLVRPEFMDLTRVPGLRTWVVTDPEAPRLLFEFHHAAVDGVGAIEFIGDVLARYGQFTSSTDEDIPELAEVDLEKIKLRGAFYGRKVTFREWLPGFLYHSWDTIRTFPTALNSRRTTRDNPMEKQSFPPYLTRILEADQLAGVKKTAARFGVSPNEIYTTVMLQTLFQWNQELLQRTPQCTRICMPISLRTPLQDNIPAGNIISYMMLNARPSAMTSFSETLQLVHCMSRNIIGTQDAPIFVRNLSILLRIPGAVWLMTRLPFSMCTAVFANVGDVKRQFRGYFPMVKGRIKAGSLQMTGLLGAAPVRPRSGIATSVGTYGRRLFINMNYDGLSLKKSDAEELLDRFVQSLLELTEVQWTASSPELSTDNRKDEVLRPSA